jgi:hypothetical protein
LPLDPRFDGHDNARIGLVRGSARNER